MAPGLRREEPGLLTPPLPTELGCDVTGYRRARPLRSHLQLLGVDVHLQQGVSEDVSEAAGVEEAVRPAVVLLVVDLRELQAAVLQQLRIMELLVGQEHLLWDIRGRFKSPFSDVLTSFFSCYNTDRRGSRRRDN